MSNSSIGPIKFVRVIAKTEFAKLLSVFIIFVELTMLSGIAQFTTIITIMVATGQCFEAVIDTIDNGSPGVGPKK